MAGVVAAVPSSVPPTPQEGSLPMKKRESGSPFPLGQVTVEFLFKKLKERAIVHLVQVRREREEKEKRKRREREEKKRRKEKREKKAN